MLLRFETKKRHGRLVSKTEPKLRTFTTCNIERDEWAECPSELIKYNLGPTNVLLPGRRCASLAIVHLMAKIRYRGKI